VIYLASTYCQQKWECVALHESVSAEYSTRRVLSRFGAIGQTVVLATRAYQSS
jgi:hypothetical protein